MLILPEDLCESKQDVKLLWKKSYKSEISKAKTKLL